MKKIIAGIIVSLLAVSSLTSSVSAYKLSDEKEQVITNSLSAEMIWKIENIVWKWTEYKTYIIYNKIQKLVFNLKMKVIARTDIDEKEKFSIIAKYNSVLYIIEKNVANKYMPQSSTWDDI